MYDVIAVNEKTSIIRVLATGKTLANAEAIVLMAVIRQGVNYDFFTEVEAGKYRDGDKYEG